MNRLTRALAVAAVALLAPVSPALPHEGDDAAFGQPAASDDRPVPVFDIGERAAGLKFQPVARGPVKRTLSVFGAVQAADNKKVDVRPTGDVTKLLVRQGDVVARGTPLALIRSTAISTLLSELVADSLAIERDIEKAKTEIGGSIETQSIIVAQSRLEFERETGLKSKGVTTESIWLLSRTKYNADKSRLAVLQKQLSETVKRLKDSLASRTKTAKSKALVMGLAEKDFLHAVEAGEATAEVLFLSPAAGVIATIDDDAQDPQKKTFSIVDTSQVWVVLDVPESDLQGVRIGLEVSVTIAEQHLAGTISSMGATVDPTSRTMPARVVFDNQGRKLIPGVPVTGDITIEQTGAQALVVPLSALVEEGGQAVVYVRQGNNLFRAAAVTAGLRNASLVEIVAGLQEEDEVVVQGARQLHAKKQLDRRGASSAHHGHAHGGGHAHGDHAHAHDHAAAHQGGGLSLTAKVVLAGGLLGALALWLMRRRK
jgi:multidrug efflux pump subunit AcrA (membrane-fusion protein)